MPDVAISPAGLPDSRVVNKIVPSYLVQLQFGNKRENFIAVKYEETTHGAKCVGFYVDANANEISVNYNDMVKTATVEQYIEVLFPWSRVLEARSLMYRHKVKVQ
jgi:hypothetical protein